MLLKEFDLIIFDLDGVLIDSKQMYLSLFQKVLAEQGFSYSEKELLPHFGPKTREVLLQLIPVKSKGREKKLNQAEKAIDCLCLSSESLQQLILRPGVKEILQKLTSKMKKTALITNSNRVFVKAVLKRFGIESFWNKIIAADDGFKNKEEGILSLIKHFNISLSKTVYIGDMVRDIEIARKVGCKIISIPGWHSREQLEKAHPDYLLSSLGELIY